MPGAARGPATTAPGRRVDPDPIPWDDPSDHDPEGSSPALASTRRRHDLVIAANRLPVDRVTAPDGSVSWGRSPGGLVTAMDAVMRDRGGAWVGWDGETGKSTRPFTHEGMYLRPVALSTVEVEEYYEGFSNDTLWPIYHDVIVPPSFHRDWWRTYVDVNQRFADAIAEVAADGATVWVQDYQLQLVPRMVREQRPDLRIGWFNHIPFPAVELFAQIPWRREILEGLLGADLLGFQRAADAQNFLRGVRRLLDLHVNGDHVTVHGPGEHHKRQVRAGAFPISVDADGMEALARKDEVMERSRQIRADLGDPKHLLLGIDRLDYTKGIRHRLKAYQELLSEGALSPPETVLVQVATPSRERVDAYRRLRDQVEVTVGRINGEEARIGLTAVHYLHHSYPREEMAALYLAGDVMLVTPLRDGMNLVAKEYVAARHDDGGALVLSEFTGAAEALRRAFLCNPHDIDGLKAAILAALHADPRDLRRRMRALRRQVFTHDVQRWARDYLDALRAP